MGFCCEEYDAEMGTNESPIEGELFIQLNLLHELNYVGALKVTWVK